HVRLRVLPTPDQDGAGWTKAQEYRAIARLPRDEKRGKHGGARIACPKHPDAPLTRTRIWRCTADGCTWVTQDMATIVSRQDQEGPGSVSMHGATFHAEAFTPVENPAQDGPVNTTEGTPDQDGAGSPRRLIPASMVSREDMEAAAGPHYWGEAPPDEPAP